MKLFYPILIIVLMSCLPVWSKDQRPAYLNTALSFEERTKDLVRRMTAAEKISQMTSKVLPIEQLGNPYYNWMNECLHGVANMENFVTVFPKSIGMGVSWDKEIGDWMAVNREFVYGTRVWKTYKEGRHDLLEEYYDTQDLSGVVLPFTSDDFRFSVKGNVVYAACLNWPQGEFKIQSMGASDLPDAEIIKIEILGSQESLIWQQEDTFLRITPPSEKPCNYVFVFKVIMENNL